MSGVKGMARDLHNFDSGDRWVMRAVKINAQTKSNSCGMNCSHQQVNDNGDMYCDVCGCILEMRSNDSLVKCDCCKEGKEIKKCG